MSRTVLASPSPGRRLCSGTLAVIRAQAFGALGETRTRPKKGPEAGEVASEALEAED